jgi:U3 small nucleolar RNA-associated protein 14
MRYVMKRAEHLRTSPGKGDSEAIAEPKVPVNPWMSQGEAISGCPRQRRDKNGGRKQSADSKINSKVKASWIEARSTDVDDVLIDPSLTLKASRPIQPPKQPAAANPKAFKSVVMAAEVSGNDSEDENSNTPVSMRDQELMKRAFAGDDVVGEFEKEKKQTAHDEEEKIVDNTLPGWGNWTGAGLSKKEKRNRGKVLSKVDGVKKGKRRDAKLDRVILNEKRVKKVG